MPGREIVVIGASAGGVEALIEIIGCLPPRFPAAVFVVMHLPEYGVSRLPSILGRVGVLESREAVDGQSVTPGTITVAAADRHLVLRDGIVRLERGPRENHSRPAVDPLFRSAAHSYGSRAIGIILSGALYDGTAGLLSIQRHGGLTIVQDPADATFDSMPRSALRLVQADHVLPAREIGRALVELVGESIPSGANAMADPEDQIERVIRTDIHELSEDQRPEELTIYTCPDCGGTTWQSQQGPSLWFRCHVGHAYAPEVLLGQKSEELEAALWTSLRLLTERATLTRQVANRRSEIDPRAASRIADRAEVDELHAATIRELLETLPIQFDHNTVGDPPAIGNDLLKETVETGG